MDFWRALTAPNPSTNVYNVPVLHILLQSSAQNEHQTIHENRICAVALHFRYYNFGRIHKALRVTPAMETGISDHVWSPEEIAALADL